MKMTKLKLVIDELDREHVRIYGKHPKHNFTNLICIVHVNMIEIMFGKNISEGWFLYKPDDEIDIIVEAIIAEEEE